MYKNYRVIKAGENEVYRYGHKAKEKAMACLTPNEAGFYSIPCDGGKYWTIGTSNGKYGEFAKFEDTFFSVNSAGFAWAKVGTPKAEAFVNAINAMIKTMDEMNEERLAPSAIEVLYDELGLDVDNAESDMDNDYLTENTTRSGRKVYWYIDENKCAAIYVGTHEMLTDEEIEAELA